MWETGASCHMGSCQKGYIRNTLKLEYFVLFCPPKSITFFCYCWLKKGNKVKNKTKAELFF